MPPDPDPQRVLEALLVLAGEVVPGGLVRFDAVLKRCGVVPSEETAEADSSEDDPGR